ncbi:FeoB-associated Cys-rich membrane protein [Enterococcus nangangensis]
MSTWLLAGIIFGLCLWIVVKKFTGGGSSCDDCTSECEVKYWRRQVK